MGDGRADLRRAAAVYDATPALARAASAVRGFAGGGEWMRVALATLRGGPPPAATPPLVRLGTAKYAAASAVGLAAAVVTAAGVGWLAGAAVGLLAFYAVEAQAVFLFPVALDGHPRPFAAARRLTVRAGGTVAVVGRVLPIAGHMLLGGLIGRGFRRSWAVGCLAVCVWYERVRRADGSVDLTPRATGGRLRFGARGPLSIRQETVCLGLPAPVRLLYASDLHLGRPWTAAVPDQLLAAAEAVDPHLIVLGGDLSDVPAGREPLTRLVGRLAARSPVLGVGGNHDRGPAVRHAVERGGGQWLATPRVVLGLTLSPTPTPGADVVCGHDPAVFPAAAAAGVRLVLAGHLHGGQCVLRTLTDGRQWPGCWANRWTGLRFRRGPCRMLVSRGCADTLPVRWNCPREVLWCELT